MINYLYRNVGEVLGLQNYKFSITEFSVIKIIDVYIKEIYRHNSPWKDSDLKSPTEFYIIMRPMKNSEYCCNKVKLAELINRQNWPEFGFGALCGFKLSSQLLRFDPSPSSTIN